MSRKLAKLALTVTSMCGLFWLSSDSCSWAQCNRGSCSPITPNVVTRTFREGNWQVAETANFRLYCRSEGVARQSAEQAESLRSELSTKWFGTAADKPWVPRCLVVVHASRRSYTLSAGPGSDQTVGASAVSFDAGRITSRRIDLLANDQSALNYAFPHELTHVLLRDRFSSGNLPRWADEGMAMMADTAEKQSRHLQDLRNAIAKSTEFSAADLLTTREYPRSGRRQAFYGQSIFLTQFLVAQKTPQHFVAFLERANAVGYDNALRECYGIDGMARLDRQWRSELYAGRFPPSGKTVALVLPVVSAATAYLP